MISLAFGVSVLFALGATASDGRSLATPDPPSAKAQTALVRAFAAIEVGFDLQSKAKDLEKASVELGRALDLLADCLDDHTAKRLAAVEARDMSAKLVAIAWDRRRHPERHKELKASYDGYFFHPQFPDHLMKRLKKRHAIEDYRLAWEYRLLDPGIDEKMSPSVLTPTFEALKKIRNDASILPLVYYFRHVCRDDDKDDALAFQSRQTAVLTVLAEFPGAKGVEGLLECSSWRKRQWDVLGPSYYRGEHPERLFYELTVGNSTRKDEWRKSMAAYPRDRLPAEQRQWLEEALKRE